MELPSKGVRLAQVVGIAAKGSAHHMRRGGHDLCHTPCETADRKHISGFDLTYHPLVPCGYSSGIASSPFS